MIEAGTFVEAARRHGFDWYSGVPCSFLTPFINYILQDRSLQYLGAANEGDAVALIAGAALGGRRGVTMMQNSGLGNAVSPLTSLTWTFHLPQLLIVTWRGQPGVDDEPQHALTGPITPTLLETMQIPWERFPREADKVAPALERAVGHMEACGRPYAFVMQKGTVAHHPLVEQRDGGHGRQRVEPMTRFRRSEGFSSRREVLRRVLEKTDVNLDVVLASTGFCGRELYALDDRPNQLYMVGSMGCVTLLALGLALARPDLRVVALDGDGAALMRMGAFATLGAFGPPNLVHLLLDNGTHDSTGGQATVSPHLSFAGVAAACGYAEAVEGDDVDVVNHVLDAPAAKGPRFARIAIRAGTLAGLPRPSLTPVEVKERLMKHIAAGAGRR
ncbi:MAG: phosphonopyruvate decarboxylase [Actinomycetota bacterium]|nr:phosphonopyruvate decarboxylase [Actinomycetota bacterium]